MVNMILIDSHCHLDFFVKNDKDIDVLLERSKINFVRYFLSVSISLSNFIKIKNLFCKYKNIFLSCGTHPLNIDKNYKFEDLIFYSSNDKVIAIGETGLDYYNANNVDIQKKVFRDHIRASCDLNKPIIIHSRCSEVDTLDILKEEYNKNFQGVLHCFTYNLKYMELFLDLGLYISFSGIVTFKNANHILEVAKNVPLNRILIETDSPYLSPEPFRGKFNKPSNLIFIAKFISELRNLNIYEFATIVTKNFCDLFKIRI